VLDFRGSYSVGVRLPLRADNGPSANESGLAPDLLTVRCEYHAACCSTKPSAIDATGGGGGSLMGLAHSSSNKMIICV
jgi:hypothetical protein